MLAGIMTLSDSEKEIFPPAIIRHLSQEEFISTECNSDQALIIFNMVDSFCKRSNSLQFENKTSLSIILSCDIEDDRDLVHLQIFCIGGSSGICLYSGALCGLQLSPAEFMANLPYYLRACDILASSKDSRI